MLAAQAAPGLHGWHNLSVTNPSWRDLDLTVHGCYAAEATPQDTQKAVPAARAPQPQQLSAGSDSSSREPLPGIQLPPNEFVYFQRPWETFAGRWRAIHACLVEQRNKYWNKSRPAGAGSGTYSPFTTLDLGSCGGFFSLQIASTFGEAHVLGIEGSVGCGNGTLGTQTQNWEALCGTSAIKTNLRWIRKLNLQNCLIAPEVWNHARVRQLAESGLCVDLMLSLSVVHHIDDYNAEQMGLRTKPERTQASLEFLSNLLRLSRSHIIELPDRPWLEHLHDIYHSHQGILEAICARTGIKWEMKKIFENAWMGHRELWFLQRVDGGETACTGPVFLTRFFPVVIPSSDPSFQAWLAANAASIDQPQQQDGNAVVQQQAQATIPVNEALQLVGTKDFAAKVLHGTWANARGERVVIKLDIGKGALEAGASVDTTCWVCYVDGSSYPLRWSSAKWCMANHAGEFFSDWSISTGSRLGLSKGMVNSLDQSCLRMHALHLCSIQQERPVIDMG